MLHSISSRRMLMILLCLHAACCSKLSAATNEAPDFPTLASNITNAADDIAKYTAAIAFFEAAHTQLATIQTSLNNIDQTNLTQATQSSITTAQATVSDLLGRMGDPNDPETGGYIGSSRSNLQIAQANAQAAADEQEADNNATSALAAVPALTTITSDLDIIAGDINIQESQAI